MPQVRMRDTGNTLRTISQVRMRDAGGTLRTIQRIRMRDEANALRTVFSSYTVSLDRSSINGFASGAAVSGDVTTGSVTGTASGGTAPYTYSWEFVSGDAEVVADTDTSNSTTFTVTGAYEGIAYTGVYKLVVTDNDGDIVESSNVTVVCRWISTL